MKAYNIIWDFDGEDLTEEEIKNLNLPDEIEIPGEIFRGLENEDVEELENLISDYISDLTGWCHKGYNLSE